MEGLEYLRKTQLLGLILTVLFTVLLPSINCQDTRVDVSVVVNPVIEDRNATIQCRTWDIPLGEIVVIEFSRRSRPPYEPLLRNGQFDDRVGDNFIAHKELQNDGSTIHTLTITYVYRFNAGTYRCKVGAGPNEQFRTTASGSAYLDVVHFPSDIYPSCSIVGSDKSLFRTPGSEVLLGCTSEYGSPIVNLQWTRTGNGYLPPPEDNSNGVVYSEIRVTLLQSDNGVAFTCTATSFADDSYKSTCLVGPFQVTTDPNEVPTFPPPPPKVTTDPPPTPTPNTQVVITAPGAPFLEHSTAAVVCQVWELASNYIVSIVRTTTSGVTETLVYNSLLLGTRQGKLDFQTSPPQSDDSTVFTLTFYEIQLSDAGSYTCTIYEPLNSNSFKIKVTDTTMFEVNFIPTTEPPVYASVALTQPSPVMEGDRAYVQCVASGITESGLVMSIESSTSANLGTLAHDGQLSITASNANMFFLLVEDNRLIDGTLSYFMTITNVRRMDSGTYDCVLRRAYGSQSEVSRESKNLQVNDRTIPSYPPTSPPDGDPLTLPTETTVFMLGPEESVEEDAVATFTCQIWGLEGSLSIYIERTTQRSTEQLVVAGQLADDVRDYIFLTPQGQTDGSFIYFLTLRFVSIQESGTYTCHVKQPLGSNSLLTIASDSYYLNVVAPTPPPPTPPPVATVPPTGTRAVISISDNLAHEGSTVLFQCHVHELRSYQRVTIERSTARGSETLLYEDEIPFTVADNFFVSILPQADDSKMYYMTIKDVHRSDAGAYTCSVYDIYQKSIQTMSSLELDIAYLPDEGLPICPKDTANRKYKVGDEITLSCSSGFGKPRVGIHWTVDTEVQEAFRGSYEVLENTVHSELKIEAASEHHNATFTCSVTSNAYEDTGYSCSIGPLSVSSAPKTMATITLVLILSVMATLFLR